MGYRLLALACLLGLLVVVAPTAQAHPHVVQPGESLWSISAASGTSVESLAAANGLPPETHVWAGRVVEVPAAAAAGRPRSAPTAASRPRRSRPSTARLGGRRSRPATSGST